MKITLIPLMLFFMLLTPFRLYALIGGVVDTKKNFNGVIQIFNATDGASCTAAKVSESFILTAAHCMQGVKKEELVLGITGDTNPADRGYSKIEVKEIYINPMYKKIAAKKNRKAPVNYFSADLALIKVVPSQTFHELNILELDFSNIPAGREITIWGYGCEKSIYQDLKKTFRRKFGKSMTLDKDKIHKGYADNAVSDYYTYYADTIFESNFISEGMMRNKASPSICLGDSGGPVISKGKIVGVNSNYTMTEKSSGVSYINIHARISVSKAWIQKIMYP